MAQEKTTAKDFLGIRTKREALGMTLKDVFAVTRISVVNLEAIEAGDFPSLPAPTYTKNFIKTYARALDMDGKPILDSYQVYLDSLQTPAQQNPEKENGRAEEDESQKKSPVEKKGLARYKVYIVAALILVIAAIAGIVVLQQQQPLPTVEPSAPPVASGTPDNEPAAGLPVQSEQTTESGTAQPVATEVNKQMPAQPGLPQQKDAALAQLPPAQNASTMEKQQTVVAVEGSDVLLIRATEETWLRIKIDQNPPFQVLLKPGEVIQRKGASFGMDIGNAGGIKVQFKGKVIENLGKSGEVVHVQLP